MREGQDLPVNIHPVKPIFSHEGFQGIDECSLSTAGRCQLRKGRLGGAWIIHCPSPYRDPCLQVWRGLLQGREAAVEIDLSRVHRRDLEGVGVDIEERKVQMGISPNRNL